jgi:hypothetical protein
MLLLAGRTPFLRVGPFTPLLDYGISTLLNTSAELVNSDLHHCCESTRIDRVTPIQPIQVCYSYEIVQHVQIATDLQRHVRLRSPITLLCITLLWLSGYPELIAEFKALS